MRYLGIDYGSTKVGLALSDEAGTMGFPHGIAANAPALVDDIAALIAKENVEAVVMGESKDLAGNDNPIAASAQAFARTLRVRADVPVYFEPEMFTTAEARRARDMRDPKSRAPQDRSAVDASAAALILTSYLSRTNHGQA